jgi:probable F420-dependent oxidoreductase
MGELRLGITGGLWFHEIPAWRIGELGGLVEQAGFESLWVGDHLALPAALPEGYPYTDDGHVPFPADTPLLDPLVLLGVIAAATTRLNLGTAVYLLPLRAPVAVARAVATVSALGSGRFTFGIGTGWIRREFDDAGVGFDDRGARTDEMIPLLRALWSGDVVEHHGAHYDVGPLQCLPRPDPRPPIHMGGESARALRRAAALGDGWIGMNHAPEDAPAAVARVRGAMAAAGRDADAFEVTIQAVGVPDAAALDRYRASGADRLLVLARPLADGLSGNAPDAFARFTANLAGLSDVAGLASHPGPR